MQPDIPITYDFSTNERGKLYQSIVLSIQPNTPVKVVITSIVSDKDRIKELLATYNMKLKFGGHVLTQLMKIRECMKGFFLVPVSPDIIQTIQGWTNGFIENITILQKIAHNPNLTALWKTYDLDYLRKLVQDQEDTIRILSEMGINSKKDLENLKKKDVNRYNGIKWSIMERIEMITDLIHVKSSKYDKMTLSK